MNKPTSSSIAKMSISLSPNLRNDIEKYSKEFGVSKSGFIADAIEYYLDFLDLSIAEKRKKEGNISSSEMESFINGL